MALNGASVWMFVYDKDYTGTKFTDKYIPVSEQTSLSNEVSMNLIEAGNKADSHQRYLVGKEEGSLSLEALVNFSPGADEKGFLVLKNSFKQRKKVYVKKAQYDGTNFSNVEYVEAFVETISEEFPDDDVATLSVDLKLNGSWQTTAPTIQASDVVGSAG